MMTGIGVQHRSDSVFSFDRNRRSGWAGIRTPSNSPPTQISTHGEFSSPRGCRGTFGSVGTAEATRIEADFTGTDCQLATFTGRVVLTKG